MLARPTAATLATKKHLSLVAARLELPAEPSLRALVRQPEEMVALMAEKAGDRVTTEELRALVDELAAVAPAPGDDEAEAERKHSLRNEIKARLPAWVPCSINGGWRSAEHFVSRQIIGLESDAMPG